MVVIAAVAIQATEMKALVLTMVCFNTDQTVNLKIPKYNITTTEKHQHSKY